jgi:hypothetical protein
MKTMTTPWQHEQLAPSHFGPLAMPRGYYLYSLSTGRVINRNHWTALPMPNDVIDRVHILAHRTAANVALIFADRHGELIPNYDDDDPNDEDYTPPDNDDATDNDDHDDLYPWDDDDEVPNDVADNIAGVNDKAELLRNIENAENRNIFDNANHNDEPIDADVHPEFR